MLLQYEALVPQAGQTFYQNKQCCLNRILQFHNKYDRLHQYTDGLPDTERSSGYVYNETLILKKVSIHLSTSLETLLY